MIIRPINKSEIPFLEEMLYEALYVRDGEAPLPRSIVKDPALQKYIELWGSQENDMAIVVEMEKNLVGAIWGRTFPAENPGWGFVAEDIPEISMAVKAEYRGKGIGSKLLEAIAEAYRKQGIISISLSVDQENRAKDLYLRHNYKIVSTEETAFTMLKVL